MRRPRCRACRLSRHAPPRRLLRTGRRTGATRRCHAPACEGSAATRGQLGDEGQNRTGHGR
ncbi:MAG: hypothetical protein F4X99_06110 [Gammaproteobacteria bacterium]|nr:hypothetical protein [Gammaproteobacteria bacterium]